MGGWGRGGQVQKEKMTVKTKSSGCASQNWWKSKHTLEKIRNVSKRSYLLEKCKCGKRVLHFQLSTIRSGPAVKTKGLRIERFAGWVQIPIGVVKAFIHEQFWSVGPVRHNC